MENERYIGDGVYTRFDGWYVWLYTDRESGGRHEIALEPKVFNELHKFCKEIWTEEKP
jgi:hypothetical protein